MAKKFDKDFQDELDVYQAVWVLGKQRGEEMPLDKEKLEKLLEAGRLSGDLLGDKEKELVGGGESEKEETPAEIMEKKIRVVNTVVNHMEKGVEKKFVEMIGKEEADKLDEMNLSNGVKMMFYTYYGKSAQVYKEDLLKALNGR